MLEVLSQIVGGAGDPNFIARLIPDSGVWPHYLAVMLRAYRIPEYLFWFGLGLLLFSLVQTILRYQAGNENLLGAFLRFTVIGALWAGSVVTPGMNGCRNDPQYRGLTPCVLSGNWVAMRQELVGTQVQVPTLDANGQIVLETVAINQKPVYRITFNPSPGVDNDSPIGRMLKGVWGQFNLWSNRALFHELARQQNGIREAKKALNQLFLTIGVTTGASGALSAVGNLLSGAGSFAIPGIFGVLSNVGGQALEAVADTTTRLVQGIGGSLVSAMLFGPIALLTVYHAINTLSGAVLYLVLFGAPVILGLAGLVGFPLLLGTLRLILLVLLIPLMTAPVFGMALRVIYGGYGEKTEQVENLSRLAENLISDKDPTRPFRTVHQTRLALTQLANTYACAKALLVEKGTGSVPGVFCPQNLDGLFYIPGSGSDWKAKADALQRLTGAQNLKEFIGQHSLAVPALIAIPHGGGSDLKKAAERFVKDMSEFMVDPSEPMSALGNRAKMESFLEFVKVYRPGFIWGWGPYIDYLKEQNGVSKNSCSDRSGSYVQSLASCLGLARENNATDVVERKDINEALKKAKEIDRKFNAGNIFAKSLGLSRWDEVKYGPTLPTNLSASFTNYAGTQESGNGGASVFYRIGSSVLSGYQPTAPYVALDNAYLHLVLTGSLPETLRQYAQSTMITTVVTTIVATLLSLLLVSSTWGLLGGLIGAAGEITGQVGGTLASTFASTAAISGTNLAASAPTTTAVDAAARSGGSRIRFEPRKPKKDEGDEDSSPRM
ncbi:hypothetical protein [Thermus sp.]|uniref:hypothetical protein n=1 Tax=Thermus sp. TaxID=275 RepID=UPI00263165FF|nr:hypothetical protein [Thermus sp.]MCX7849663.1 hypothetical protein [Thermus sp.]